MKPLKRLIYCAVFASLICITTSYIAHIPTPGGGYIHPGDAVIYLCACLLPLPWAMAAAALGGVLADLLTAPVWAIWTLFIKALLVPAFSRKNPRLLCSHNILACCVAAVITLIGYYFANWAILGTAPSLAAYLPGDSIQVIASTLIFLALSAVFDRTRLRERLFSQL